MLKQRPEVVINDLPFALSQFPKNDANLLAVESVSLMGKAHLLVTTDQGQSLFDPETQTIISPLSESLVCDIVKFHLAQNSELVSVQLLTELPVEVRGRPAPIWQAQLADDDNSRLYVSPISGHILAKRTDTWRLFDFFWMLHIMDYDKRSDFNHPLLIISTLLALFVAVSGIWLLFYTIKLKSKKTPSLFGAFFGCF